MGREHPWGWGLDKSKGKETVVEFSFFLFYHLLEMRGVVFYILSSITEWMGYYKRMNTHPWVQDPTGSPALLTEQG